MPAKSRPYCRKGGPRITISREKEMANILIVEDGEVIHELIKRNHVSERQTEDFAKRARAESYEE